MNKQFYLLNICIHRIINNLAIICDLNIHMKKFQKLKFQVLLTWCKNGLFHLHPWTYIYRPGSKKIKQWQ